MNRKLICQILNHEMMLATGCTEPAAIALTAAIAREQLDGELEHIKSGPARISSRTRCLRGYPERTILE